jgi:hypothetical protein
VVPGIRRIPVPHSWVGLDLSEVSAACRRNFESPGPHAEDPSTFALMGVLFATGEKYYVNHLSVDGGDFCSTQSLSPHLLSTTGPKAPLSPKGAVRGSEPTEIPPFGEFAPNIRVKLLNLKSTPI